MRLRGGSTATDEDGSDNAEPHDGRVPDHPLRSSVSPVRRPQEDACAIPE